VRDPENTLRHCAIFLMLKNNKSAGNRRWHALISRRGRISFIIQPQRHLKDMALCQGSFQTEMTISLGVLTK